MKAIVMCRVIMGRLCFLFEERLHADRTTIRTPDGVRWVGVTDASEDSVLQEAWRRLCREQDLESRKAVDHSQPHALEWRLKTPPDGEYLFSEGALVTDG